MNQRESVEAFLRNVKSGDFHYSEENVVLAIRAMDGENPCEKCKRKKGDNFCGVMNCLPYYRWFQYRWRRLQKGMLHR